MANERPVMTNEMYQEAQDSLIICGRVLDQHDWSEFISRINHCESVGHVLDPTLYRAGAERLAIVKKLAESARTMSEHIRVMRELVAKEEGITLEEVVR